MSTKPGAPRKPSPVVRLAMLGILGIGLAQAFQSSQWVDAHIAALPVVGQAGEGQGDGAAAPAAATLDRNIVPLLMESQQKKELMAPSLRAGEFAGTDSIDRIFGNVSPRLEARLAARARADAQAQAQAQDNPTSAAAPEMPPAVVLDYFKLLEAQVTVQALTPGAAVINGRLFEVGEPVTTLAYPSSADPARKVHPVLLRRVSDGVVLREAEGERQFTARMAF